jgi:acyl-CoA reductase-like NAD-dependent aldehyde dehydrogenase
MSSGNTNKSQEEATQAVDAAFRAWSDLAKFDQQKIDSICDAMASAALAESARLGRIAHDETGFGRPEDKAEKNRFAAQDVWNHFRNLKTVGVVRQTESVVEIVSPRGVVAAVIPSTNPTSTAIFKIIISIKSRNTIVLSPHPSASKCIQETARVMKVAGVAAGLPADAIQCLTITALEGTEALMKHPRTAVILATGGLGLVRAAYSSGKPAFGVGPGNVPVFIERTAEIKKAVSDVLTGTCFDNGTICASEQAVVADAPIARDLRAEFIRQGAYFLNVEQAEKVGRVLITEKRTLNPEIVGRSAVHIADLAGINIPAGTRCLIADCAGVGRDFPWSFEKLSPTLAFFVVDGINAGAEKCIEILRFGGMGHTAGMHSASRDAAIRFGERMPASRIIINSPTTHGAIGLSTDLSPSMTLGCGSWGGNVTSDNVSPIHLMDIKRVAFETKRVSREFTAESHFSQSDAPKRENISRIVDRFLSSRGSQGNPMPTSLESGHQNVTHSEGALKMARIHEVGGHDGYGPPVDFVSEDDVRRAAFAGQKIVIGPKTIITPAAKDLASEKGVFIGDRGID